MRISGVTISAVKFSSLVTADIIQAQSTYLEKNCHALMKELRSICSMNYEIRTNIKFIIIGSSEADKAVDINLFGEKQLSLRVWY